MIARAPTPDDPCPVGLRGIVPSLNTPFDAEGALDTASLRRLVEARVAAGCAGMLVLAVAGEGASLAREEKRRAVEAILEANAGRVPVIVSVSAAESAERVAMARVLGAAGVSCRLGERLRSANSPVAEPPGSALHSGHPRHPLAGVPRHGGLREVPGNDALRRLVSIPGGVPRP